MNICEFVFTHFLLFMDYRCFDLLIMCKPAHLLETGDLFPRPIAPSRPEFSLSSPSWSSLVWNLIRPKTTPDTSVKPACGCSCSAERFRDLCHHRNSLASSAGPLETNETCSYKAVKAHRGQTLHATQERVKGTNLGKTWLVQVLIRARVLLSLAAVYSLLRRCRIKA